MTTGDENMGDQRASARDGWVLREWSGSAADFHAMDTVGERAMWWCTVDAPALILGSTQSADDVDHSIARRAGFEVVRRRSGGGIVPVEPGGTVWIDVTIPRHDPLWTDDVTTSMIWLGRVFANALAPWVSATVHEGPFQRGEDGRTVCFASTSPGEVFAGGAKLVGISQRRGRAGARMQCVLYRSWDPAHWTVALTDPDLARRVGELAVATIDAPAADIVAAVFAALPR